MASPSETRGYRAWACAPAVQGRATAASAWRLCALLALPALTAPACGGTTVEVLERPEPSYLEPQGSDLIFGGQRYHFLSFSAFTLTGCGRAEEIPSDAELTEFFDSLRPRSLVRTYAFQGYPLEGVDRVVRAADRHGHLLALVLADHLGSCGGGGERTAEWYESTFRNEYLPWVRRVVSRYQDESAVGLWEPMKGIQGIDALTVRTFYDVVGGEIHRLDSNHPIEAGTHGPWAYGGPAGYRLIVESPGIDVATFHDYDGRTAVPPSLEDTIAAMQGLEKPVALIETGIFAGLEADPSQQRGGSPCISHAQRRDLFEAQLQAAFSAGVVGVSIWNWTPAPQPDCEFRIAPGDPLIDLVQSFQLP